LAGLFAGFAGVFFGAGLRAGLGAGLVVTAGAGFITAVPP